MSEQSMKVVAVRPVRALEQILNSRLEALKKWAAGRLDPAALVRWALLEYSKSEQLRRCTPESIYTSLITAAQFGLEPSGIRGEGYIVPFGRTAVFIPGYRGYIVLARRANIRLVPHLVYENDVFELDYMVDRLVVHKPALRDRGEIMGAYAWARLPDDEFDVEFLPIEELEHIREVANRTRGGKDSPAYADHEGQMYRKSPIRRIAKRIPLGEEMARAVALDIATETGDLATYHEIIDVPSEGQFDAPLEEVETRGVAGAKAQIQRRAKQTPASDDPPSPPHDSPASAEPVHPEGTIELADQIRGLYSALETIFQNPELLPMLRAQVERLPDVPDKPLLQKQLARAERIAKEDAAAEKDPRGA